MAPSQAERSLAFFYTFWETKVTQEILTKFTVEGKFQAGFQAHLGGKTV